MNGDQGTSASALGNKIEVTSRNLSPSAADPRSSYIESILGDLPRARGGFTDYRAPPPSETFKRYTPDPEKQALYPAPATVHTDRTRCLIRALQSKLDITGAKRPAPVAEASGTKRLKDDGWAALGREQKQACLRVALAAACAQSDPAPNLLSLRAVWAENPRKKQLVNADVRVALADSAQSWAICELRDYLDKAGIAGDGGGSREYMARRVRAHLRPRTSLP